MMTMKPVAVDDWEIPEDTADPYELEDLDGSQLGYTIRTLGGCSLNNCAERALPDNVGEGTLVVGGLDRCKSFLPDTRSA